LNFVGDCVWAVFNTPYQHDIDEVFDLTAKLNSLMQVLNYKLKQAGYSRPIRAGIGASWGRALMIQAGYRGTAINDVVYMGDVVNYASKLAAKANVRKAPAYQPYYYQSAYYSTYTPSIYLGNDFVSNLNEENSKFISKDQANNCYTANVINTAMDEWFRTNCA
jgi:hypothetical protein